MSIRTLWPVVRSEIPMFTSQETPTAMVMHGRICDSGAQRGARMSHSCIFPPEDGTRTVRILHPVFDVVVRVRPYMAPVIAEEDIVSLGTVKMLTIYFGITHDGRHCQSECSREYILQQTTSVWQSSLTRGREIPTFPVPITHTSQIPEILDRTYVCISLVIS